jgi:hypothetical protein
MTSSRKIESNKRNASRSTGPRTAGGKSRSKINARRHGLATRLEDGYEQSKGIECLTAILANGNDDFIWVEQSRVVAECHFDLRRIRTARHDVFLKVHDLANVSGNDLEDALCAMDRISRYERRARSKRKQALCKLSNE